jgi:predicted ATPase
LAQTFGDVVAMVARARPLGIFLDDQQWADPSTQDLLEPLRVACERGAALVVVAFRPDEGLPQEKSLLERGAERVVLGPLSRAATAALVSALLPPDPARPISVDDVADRSSRSS